MFITFADYQETCIAASESNFLHDPIEYDEEEYPRNEVFILPTRTVKAHFQRVRFLDVMSKCVKENYESNNGTLS